MNSPQRLRLLRGVCRFVGHRWVWRTTEDERPYHYCTRCESGWELGQRVERRLDR